MSGIAAIIHFDGRPADNSQIRAMTQRMAFRGPDGIRHFVSGSVALGQCMLCTTAESLEAKLPLQDESGQVVLIMDGRIDNYDELRLRLSARGALLKTAADEELVLQSYLLFGENCADYLEGDFAIVIWDARRQRAFCLRDHFAHKSFHYTWNGATLSIATEVAPLLDLPWVSEQLNELTVAEFVEANWFSKDASLWKDIHRLPAAHMLKCSKEGLTCTEYWQPEIYAECPVRSEGELVELYRELFTSSVKRKSRSHKPIACEVSGGLDSSAIFAVAVNQQRRGQFPAPSLHGYTLKIEADNAANDLPYARRVAEHLQTNISEIPPSLQSLEWYKDRVIKRRDFMGYPNGFMNFGILEDAKAKGCAVLLNGTGGDEWLTGDSRIDYADALMSGPQSLWRVCRADRLEYGSRHVLKRILRYGMGSNLPEPIRSAFRSSRSGRSTQRAQERWVEAQLYSVLEMRSQAGKAGGRNFERRGQRILESMLALPFRSWVYDLNDRDAADFQIERREPFDDKRIIQLAYSLPLWMFRRGSKTKFFHRNALEDLLPPMVTERRDKAVFSTVLAHHNTALREEFVEEKPSIQGLIDHRKLLASCVQATSDDVTEMDLGVRLWPLWAAVHLQPKSYTDHT